MKFGPGKLVNGRVELRVAVMAIPRDGRPFPEGSPTYQEPDSERWWSAELIGEKLICPEDGETTVEANEVWSRASTSA
jgi:hypothetical protein